MISTVSKRGAYITVYCSLSFMVILSLIMVLFEGARTNGARLMCEYAVDIGMDSILAEYHRELFDRYDLLFIDTSYGLGTPSLETVSNHLKIYVDKNLDINGETGIIAAPDLYGLETASVNISNPSYATDSKGLVFRRQAEEEREQMMGIDIISSIVGKMTEQISDSPEEGRYDSFREQIEEEISSVRETEYEVSEGEYEKIEINNPADGVNSLRGTGILILAMKDTSDISKASFEQEDRLEYRKINSGIGLNTDKYEEETALDKACYREYLNEYFGNYRNPKEDSYLKYELEYILAGKSSDMENLEYTAKKIFAVREASNAQYLLADKKKRVAIKALAETVSGVSMVPGLDRLLEYSILFAWSFGESVVDMRTLYKGGKVPLTKSDSTWQTDLDFVLQNSFMDFEGSEGGTGLSYEEYLKMFLWKQDIDVQSIRALDAMELSIRQTKGNAAFRIDGCMEGAGICVNITDPYEDAFTLARNCYY